MLSSCWEGDLLFSKDGAKVQPFFQRQKRNAKKVFFMQKNAKKTFFMQKKPFLCRKMKQNVIDGGDKKGGKSEKNPKIDPLHWGENWGKDGSERLSGYYVKAGEFVKLIKFVKFIKFIKFIKL